MSALMAFVIGLFVGAPVGLFIMALLVASRTGEAESWR